MISILKQHHIFESGSPSPVYVTASRASIGFGNLGCLTPLRRLIRFLFVRPALCLGLPSDSQSPATPFPLAKTYHCLVCRGLSPPSHQRGHHSQAGCACAQRAMHGAPKKTAPLGAVLKLLISNLRLIRPQAGYAGHWSNCFQLRHQPQTTPCCPPSFAPDCRVRFCRLLSGTDPHDNR